MLIKRNKKMNFRKTFTYLTLATAVLLAGAFTASAADNTPNGKKITFTTKSKEAKDNVAEIVRSIESFKFGNEWLPLAQKAVEADPEFAFAHYLVATATPPPNAKPHADKAVELSKKASEAERRYIEAVFLTRAQKHDEAIAIFTDLARQYPEERMVQMMLGQVSMAKGNLDQARTHFEQARKLDGSTPRVYAFLGNIHLIKGDYGKAREYFKTSLNKKAPGTAPGGPAYGLAFSHLYEGDLATALKTLEAYQVDYANTAGARDFPPVFVWNSIGRLLLENGRAADSIKAYESGYATVSGSNLPEQEKKVWLGRLHHGKGRALAKMGKHEEAWKEAELIKKMIDEGGEQGQQFMPAYHYIAGYLKLERGDYAKAVEHLKQSDLTDPFHKLLLARAYEKAGDEANAQKLYKEIVTFPFNSMERALAYPEAKKKVKS